MSVETAVNEESVDMKKEPDSHDEEMSNASDADCGDKKKEKPKKKKYTDWPLKDIKEPHEHDVLYGRGGGTNHHPGNKRYRKMVEERKMDYVNSKRLDKPLVALEIIRQWRDQDPPGRFLKIDERSGLWNDVGDKKAREKTSQALREKAPLLRQQQEQEKDGSVVDDDDDDDDEDGSKPPPGKTTRFAEGTNKQKDDPKKAILARDHSLGREYIEAGDAVTLEGFSWQDPLQEIYPGQRTSSQGSLPDGPPPNYYCYPPGRMNSQGSMGVPHPNYHQSVGSYPMRYRTLSEDRHSQYASSGRYESWGQPISSMGSNGPPMPPPPVPVYGDPYIHQRSGSWGPTSSWGPPQVVGRDHSLTMNPLRDATTSQAAMPSAFESGRVGSGYWVEVPPVPPRGGGGPPQQFRPPPRTSSGQSGLHLSSPSRAPPSPYNVDPAIAETWSSQSDDYEKVAGMMEYEVQRTWSGEEYGRMMPRRSGGNSLPREKREDGKGELSRPNIVKRATSNQNETLETKPDLRGPSVKRAALNRDNSLVSNRLKAQYMNTTLKETDTFDSDKEVRNLSGNLEQTSLEVSERTIRTRPKPLSATERVNTIDKIAMELMVKPEPLSNRSRSSTIEALALDFDDDQIMRPDLDRMSSLNSVFSNLAKPAALAADGRVTTMDLLDMVNRDEEPLGLPELNREVSVSDWLADV